MKRGFSLVVSLGVGGSPAMAAAQQLAFPEAEGFGRFATGARTSLPSASVYHVTNLNAYGAGSFREAVSQPNRFVVFDVGGVVDLRRDDGGADPVIVQDNVTIAGQTAPGGIALYGQKVSYTSANNTVSRYLAIRKGSAGGRDDAASIARGTNMMFDHMSVTWGVDETFSMNPDSGHTIDNITIQNSIIGQGLDVVNHSAGGLMTIGNGRFSVLRSLFIDNETRNPKVRGNNQFVNNVVYNWTTAAYIMGDTSATSNANVEGNYFIEGPNNGGAPFTDGTGTFHIYQRDNWLDADRDGVLDGSLLGAGAYSGADVVATPHAFPAVTVTSAQQAYQHVVNFAGPSITRDAADGRMIQELTSLGTVGQIVVRESSLFPDYPSLHSSRARLTDGDNDGMPDNWETARQFGPSDPADWKTVGASGYTRLEEYLNELGAHGAIKTWTAASGNWPGGASWAGGAPTLADEVFVRGSGAGTNGQVTVAQVGASARRLYVGGNGAAAGERVTVAAGGTLDVFDTLHVGHQNHAAVDVAGGGTLTAGRVLLGSPGGLGGKLTLATGGTLQTGAITPVLGGTASFDWNGGTFRATGAPAVAVPTTLGGDGGTFDTNGYSGTFSGIIGGPGALTKTGLGTLTLAGDNAYAGGTTVGGNLKVAHDRGAGTGAITISSAGGTVQLADGVTVANDVRTNYGFEVLDVPDAGAAGTFAGALTQLGSNNIRIQTTGAGATLNVTGSINAGTRSLFLKTGNVVVAGSGAVTGNGGAVGRGGAATTLTLRDAASFNIGAFSMGGGQGLPSAAITVRDTATLSTGAAALDLLSTTSAASASALNLDGGTTTVGAIAKTSTGAAQTSALNFNGGTLKYGGTAANANFLNPLPGLAATVRVGGAKVDDNAQAVAIAAALVHDAALGSTRDGGLTKLGAGTLTLTGANTYTGDTTVLAGTLKLGAAEVLPHGAGKGFASLTGTLDLNGISAAVNSLSGAATGVVDNLAPGAVALSVGDNNATNTGAAFNGVIRNTGGTLSLTKIGAGTFRMQGGASTYAGDTTIAAGTLDLNGANLLPSGPGKGDVRLNALATLGVRAAQSFNALADGAAGGGTLQALNSGTKTVTLGAGDASGAFSGAVQNGAGAIALTKSGAGTQTFSGANTYTGVTIVNAGTLRVNGTHTGGGLYTLNAGGTLAGGGSITAPLVVRGAAAVAPGNSAGVLSVGDVGFDAGGDFAVELNGPTAGTGAGRHDQLVVNGTVNLGGNAAGAGGADLLASLGYVPAVGDRLFILANDGTDPITTRFQGLPEGATIGLVSAVNQQAYSFRISYVGDAELDAPSGGNDVMLLSVPEPTGGAGLLAAGAGALCSRRRRLHGSARREA